VVEELVQLLQTELVAILQAFQDLELQQLNLPVVAVVVTILEMLVVMVVLVVVVLPETVEQVQVILLQHPQAKETMVQLEQATNQPPVVAVVQDPLVQVEMVDQVLHHQLLVSQ
jgi:predicted PurR-regulated permease PerM